MIVVRIGTLIPVFIIFCFHPSMVTFSPLSPYFFFGFNSLSPCFHVTFSVLSPCFLRSFTLLSPCFLSLSFIIFVVINCFLCSVLSPLNFHPQIFTVLPSDAYVEVGKQSRDGHHISSQGISITLRNSPTLFAYTGTHRHDPHGSFTTLLQLSLAPTLLLLLPSFKSARAVTFLFYVFHTLLLRGQYGEASS